MKYFLRIFFSAILTLFVAACSNPTETTKTSKPQQAPQAEAKKVRIQDLWVLSYVDIVDENLKVVGYYAFRFDDSKFDEEELHKLIYGAVNLGYHQAIEGPYDEFKLKNSIKYAVHTAIRKYYGNKDIYVEFAYFDYLIPIPPVSKQ